MILCKFCGLGRVESCVGLESRTEGEELELVNDILEKLDGMWGQEKFLLLR